MSTLLGVRRESVTAAARRLQQAGVIRCRRGHITVLDRHRLEQRACECYLAARQ
jgi:Mn-dependent DtxR family transcriptional regulator